MTVTAEANPSESAETRSDNSTEKGLDTFKKESDTFTGGRSSTVVDKTMWDYEHGKISDTAFVKHVRANTTTLEPYDESMLVVLAQTTCAAVANGTTKTEIVEKQSAMAASRQDGVLTKEMGRDVGYLLGFGSENYCPELSEELITIING